MMLRTVLLVLSVLSNCFLLINSQRPFAAPSRNGLSGLTCSSEQAFADLNCACKLFGIKCKDTNSICNRRGGTVGGCDCKGGFYFNNGIKRCVPNLPPPPPPTAAPTTTTTTTTTTTKTPAPTPAPTPAATTVTTTVTTTPTTTPTTTAPLGSLSGLVEDRITPPATAVAALAKVTVNETTSFTAVDTDASGLFTLPLPSGTHTVNFTKDTYMPLTLYNMIVVSGKITYAPLVQLLFIDTTMTTVDTTMITGTVFDLKNNKLAGAVIELRQGYNNVAGKPYAITPPTIASGLWTLSGLSAGYYTMKAVVTGYISDYVNIGIPATPIGNSIVGQNFYLPKVSTSPSAMPLTVLLHFGPTVPPLPATTYIQMNAIERDPVDTATPVHVYSANVESDDSMVKYTEILPGPAVQGINEISVITQEPTASYKFFAYDQEHSAATGTSTSVAPLMASRNVVMKVFNKNSLLHVYNAPTLPGTLWTAFNITNGTIIDINTMAYQPDITKIT